MHFWLFLPSILGAATLAAMLRMIFYRPRCDLDQVIRFARKLDTSELSRLFDADEEWGMRTLCSEKEFRRLQRERMRLAFEYVQRIGHNAELIQTWAATLYEEIRLKPRDEITEQDYLVWQLLELAGELRVYHLCAMVRIRIWLLLYAHRWPRPWMPRVAVLGKDNTFDVVSEYGRLIELSGCLSRTYGDHYCRELLSAL
ncbi:MAG TPA: hypothetical protein VJO35_18720 [Terriglobales bacterium]|nr:hypothetical protein [Terriglobales bacterium]